MKFTSVVPNTSFYVDTDEGETYMTIGMDNWFKLYGESWEPVIHYERIAELNDLLDEYYKEESTKLVGRLL